jgi:hypothetical protein
MGNHPYMNHSNQPGPGREKEIFDQALDLASADAQIGFVKGACGGDAELLARVQTLLRAHHAPAGFLPENPAPATAVTARFPLNQAAEDTGAVIGRYKLLQKIGEGGCGTVYMAQQEEPVRRRVALKVIKLGMDTKEVIARFEAERQALAMMDHPNIAKVLDAGATEKGRPFFVMELVKGIPITKYCDENNLSTEERLKIFSQVCHAVQHAHQKGIIHRDIKPSNILVTLHDGVPVPKVIDFGIAKATQGRLTDHTLFTAFEQFIGTPAYMSPEQAEMSGLDIDTRSDVYSLGVLLYELLTGSTPFETKALMQAGLDEMRRQIREVEPQRPSTRLRTLQSETLTTTAQHRRIDAPKLIKLIHGDIDWIVMRCLEKDRTRRYETATSLAQDLQRHLDNEPIEARPASRLYRFGKMVRRNRLAFAAGAVIAVLLVVGIIVSTAAYFNERAAHLFAVQAAQGRLQAANSNQTLLLKSRDVRLEAEASQKKAVMEAARSAYAVQIMQEVIKHAAARLQSGRETVSPGGHLLETVAAQVNQDQQLPPEARHGLYEMIGDADMALGEFVHAETMYRQTLALRRQLLGAMDPSTKAALDKLLEALRQQGKEKDMEQVRQKAQVLQEEFLQSDRWAHELTTRAGELQARGEYAGAEANVREAMTIGQKRLGDAYDPYPDLGQIAEIRLEEGDLPAARQLAEQWIEAEKNSRAWGSAGVLGRLFSTDTYPIPYRADALLGLVALRGGDRQKASEYLLRSTVGVTPWKKIDEKVIALAAELMAAGEKTAVLRFLDQVRLQYVDVLEGRGFKLNAGFSLSWDQYYYNVVKARENAAELDEWQAAVLAGKVPEDWRAYVAAKKPAIVASAGPLPPLQNLPVQQARAPFVLLRPLLPFSLLMVGWFSMALVTQRSAMRPLPLPAKRWLAAFCLVRALDSLLFMRALFGEGFLPDTIFYLALSIVSWAFLWEFTRALTPVRASRVEVYFVRSVYRAALIGLGLIEVVSYLSKNELITGIDVVILVLAILLTIFLSITVAVVSGVRLGHWVREAGICHGRFSLRIGAILLGTYGLSSLFGPFIHDLNKPVGLALLWSNAILPWILIAGFHALTATPRGIASSNPIRGA